MKYQKLSFLLIFFFWLISSVNLVQAQEKLSLGVFELHPILNLKQVYEDNVYLEPKGEENKDWLSIISPGFGLTTPKDRFDLKYNVDFFRYADLTRENRTDHNLLTRINLGNSEEFNLNLTDKLKTTADPPNSEITSKEKRLRNDVTAGLSYRGEKFGFSGSYLNSRDDYKSENLKFLDKYEHLFGVTGFYQVLPKTAIFLENNYGLVKYDKEVLSNAEYEQLRLGVEGSLTVKTTALIKIGYQARNYENKQIKQFNGLTSFISLAHGLNAQAGINITGERSVEESSYGTINYYVVNKAGIQLNQKFRTKLSLTFDLMSQRNAYPSETTENGKTDKRRDDLFMGSFRIGHKLKEWLTPGINYEYRRRNSNFDLYDYTDNAVTVTLSALF